MSLLHWINKSWLPQFLVGNDNLRCGIWSELDWIYSEYIIRNDIDWQGIKGPNVIKESVWLWRLSLCSCQKVMVIFYVMLSEFWVVGGLNMNCWGRQHFYVYSAAVWYFTVFLGHKTNPLIMNHPSLCSQIMIYVTLSYAHWEYKLASFFFFRFHRRVQNQGLQ